jgi:putative zinc finger protein
MNVMDCKRLREVLDLYVDHELAPDAMVQANAHIAECSACRRAVEGLSRLREAVRSAAGPAEPCPELSARVRDMTSSSRRRAIAVPAVAAALVVAAILTLYVPSVRGTAATALDFISIRLDNSRHVVMEGTLLCRDQQLQRKYGYPAMCRITGHHGWLVTSDGRFWSILEGKVSQDLIHNSSLLGRRVRIEGRMFRKADSIEVSSYQLL